MSKVDIHNCRLSYETTEPHGSTVFLVGLPLSVGLCHVLASSAFVMCDGSLELVIPIGGWYFVTSYF